MITIRGSRVIFFSCAIVVVVVVVVVRVVEETECWGMLCDDIVMCCFLWELQLHDLVRGTTKCMSYNSSIFHYHMCQFLGMIWPTNDVSRDLMYDCSSLSSPFLVFYLFSFVIFHLWANPRCRSALIRHYYQLNGAAICYWLLLQYPLD